MDWPQLKAKKAEQQGHSCTGAPLFSRPNRIFAKYLRKRSYRSFCPLTADCYGSKQRCACTFGDILVRKSQQNKGIDLLHANVRETCSPLHYLAVVEKRNRYLLSDNNEEKTIPLQGSNPTQLLYPCGLMPRQHSKPGGKVAYVQANHH